MVAQAALPVSVPYAETLEGVQEKLWCALPSIVKLRDDLAAAAAAGKDADTAGEAKQEAAAEPDPADSPVRKATAPSSDMRLLVEALFMACHTNPVEEDVPKGVKSVLGDMKEDAMYSWDDFVQILRDVESKWLEWHDPEKKWMAVGERHHASVVKELVNCVTQDVEPFALLPPQRILTAQSVVAHSKTLVTPFEEFVNLVKPREFPEIYDTLWQLLTQNTEGSEISEMLSLAQFTEFFKWFYLRVFKNATEESAAVAASTMWIEHLNSEGVMRKKQFVRACQHMCRAYNPDADEVHCLVEFHRATLEALSQKSETAQGILFFHHRDPPEEGRMLVDPNDLYIPEALDEVKQEMELYDCDVSPNRIIICGKQGVGRETLAKALAKRLNCTHLSVEELAMEAIEKSREGDSLGVEIQNCVESQLPLSLSQLKTLIHRKISADETLYRGYVFSDFPLIHDGDDRTEILDFLNGCGILDVHVPSILIHVTCDAKFYAERRDATLDEQRALYETELQLRQTVDEENKKEVSRRQALVDRVEELQGRIKRYEELKAAAAAEAPLATTTTATGGENSNTEGPAVDIEAAKTAAAEAEAELPEAMEAVKNDADKPPQVSPESVEREKQIRDLTLRRIVEKTLTGENKTSEEIYATDLPCFREIVERIRSMGRCLTVGCTSLIEDAVDYIVETLALQPCVLPLDLGAEERQRQQRQQQQQQQQQEQGEAVQAEEDANAIIERENAMAQTVEEAARNMGAILSTRWKRFCPVTFAECGVLVEGVVNYGCVFRKRLYHLASEAKLAKFRANPLPYLRATPLDREPIFIFSTVEAKDAAKCLASETVTELIQLLHERLDLTPIEFNEFVALWEKHRKLKESRDQSLAARQKFELTERKLRADRSKKRRNTLLKSERKPKPPSQGRKGRRSTVKVLPPVEEEFKGWEEKPEGPETVSLRIEKRINEILNRRKTFVPILVHAFDNLSMESFDQILQEGVLPEKVLVLQYERPAGEENQETADDDGAANNDINKEDEPQMPQRILLEKLEKLESPAQGTGDGAKDENKSTQSFTIHRLNVNDKDGSILAAEILQLVCPGMAPVEDGAVDEELGEMEDGEEDMDLEGEDEEEGEGAAVEPVNPAAKPGKRFLNQFGSRLQYCPVTLYEKHLLVCGKNEFCSQYQQKLYVFASEEAKTKFERNPLRYLELPPPKIAPRIWIVGYTKSGRKTLGIRLQKEYNVPFFAYDRRFFERCLEAARKPGGEEVEGITIPEQTSDNPYLTLGESILKEVRDFAKEQERCMKLREEAEAIMEKRERAEEKEKDEEEENEEEEVDEEAEARLQENLEFEPEPEEERDVRLSEAYLKIASCVTRIEPFESQGYIMACPAFSEGDIELLFGTGCIPEAAVQIDLSEEAYLENNKKSRLAAAADAAALSTSNEKPQTKAKAKEEALKKWLENEQKRKERELRKWRRRHIGKDDPESEVEDDDNVDPSFLEMKEKEDENDDDNNNNNNNNAIIEGIEENRTMEEEALTEFAEAIADRFVKVTKLNGDLSSNAVFRAATRQLYRVLEHRRSLLYAAEVIRFDNAVKMIESGEANLSYFGYTDPVALYDERHGVRRICKWMPDGTTLEPEPSQLVGTDEPSDNSLANKSNIEKKDLESNGEDEEEEGQQTPSQTDSVLGGDDHDALAPPPGAHEDEDEDEEMSEHDEEEMEGILQRHERRKRQDWLRRCKRVALLCGRLYFFENDAALIRYLNDPLLFIQQPPPLPLPLNRPVISVYEDDDSALLCQTKGIKQRCTANHIAFNLHSLFISLSKLLSWAAVHTPLLSLSQRAIDAVLTDSVDDGLIAELLAHRLSAGDAKKKGVVLLNLPRTPEQCKSLKDVELRVDKIFEFNETKYTEARTIMKSDATVTVPSVVPKNSIAALTEIPECIDAFTRNEGYVALSGRRGFPMNISNSYHTTASIEANLSSYKWFCPYSWSLHEVLLDQRETRLYGAVYISKYYFFSSDEYLQRFLLHPGEITMPPGLKPLPSNLPSRMRSGMECTLELAGCCPVTLWDTREKRGLRGVLEPVAKKGDLNCIVEYEGRYYALLDEDCLKRFMMCPWKFIAGAMLPPSRKVPLPDVETLMTIDEETYMRRVLYDPVAHALIAVAQARPKYPGHSLEESALKFVALHMKCFNSKNTPMQAEQYAKNYETFYKRATLYRTVTNIPEGEAQDETFLELCREWEAATSRDAGGVRGLIHLRKIG